MAELKLELFGAPRLVYQEQPVVGVRRKALALAAYLSLTERPLMREALAALFWPDQDDEHSRISLRGVLHNLSSASPIEWVDADRSAVSLKFEALEVDVRGFTGALARTRGHLHTDGVLCAACFAALNEAVNLYHDDFMAGFSLSDSSEFDHWQTSQREWLSRECTTALRRLAEHSGIVSATSLHEALSYGRRWLKINPLDESAHRLLMRLFAASGQRSEALKQYHDCVRLLDEELATLPEPETVALFEAIREGESAPLKSRPRTFDKNTAVSVLPPLPPLLVGRDEAITELKARVGLPKSTSQRSVTVIEGWPGVGKSTTMGAFAHDPTVKARFSEGILWTSLGENPNLLRKLMVWGEALHLIPPGKTPTVDELTSQLLSALSDRHVLLIVDDVWQVEHAAPFRVGGPGSVLLLTTRLNSVARALAPTSSDVYRLPVLTDEFALSLLRRLAPQVVDEHPAEALQLVRDLEGLPLAVQVAGRLLHEEMHLGWGIAELLAELHAGAGLLVAPAPNDTLPAHDGYTAPTVMALLKRSTVVLDEETLFRFALLGLFSAKPATFDLAALAAAWSVTDPKATVRTLVNRGLLEPISGGRFQMHALLVLHARVLLESFDT